MISERASKIKPSATLAITAKAKAMKAEGIDVVGFGAGEPDFDTPDNIKDAAIKAIKQGFTKYTDASGIAELKEAVVNKFKRENNIDYAKEQVTVNNGAKHTLYNIMLALLNKNDEVILPVPYWVSYIEQVNLAEGKVILCSTDKFKIKADLIKEKVNKKTKAIILNSPCNPSGAVINDEELKKIAKLAVENNIYVISDEAYEHFIYGDKKHVSIASLNEEIKNLSLTVNAVSKTYSMTGWRIGYCAGPEEFIKAINKIQSQTTSNPCSIAQKAALEALNGSQESIAVMKKAFEERRDFIVKRLNEMKNISCEKPEGAFYVFPDISKTGLNSKEFTEKLLEQEKVAVVPGIEFGDDNCVRLSYACSMDNIVKGMDRIKRFCGGG